MHYSLTMLQRKDILYVKSNISFLKTNSWAKTGLFAFIFMYSTGWLIYNMGSIYHSSAICGIFMTKNGRYIFTWQLWWDSVNLRLEGVTLKLKFWSSHLYCCWLLHCRLVQYVHCKKIPRIYRILWYNGSVVYLKLLYKVFFSSSVNVNVWLISERKHDFILRS